MANQQCSKPYNEILISKLICAPASGFTVDKFALNPKLREDQRCIVALACKRGKSALFLDTGTGKTFMQLEWARLVAWFTGKPVLILTPLAVAAQTVREGNKFGINACQVRSQPEVKDRTVEFAIFVANYEMLEHFDPSQFAGIVLDESSILKSYTGTTKRAIIEAFKDTPYKLACTATPAPNDHMEIGNHAQFLDVMSSSEMLSRWFLNDTMKAGGYRLKGHAIKDFWRWVATWAVSYSVPSDVGFSDQGFSIPKLHIIQHVVKVDQSIATEGMLFRSPDLSATGLHKEMRLTADSRAAKCAEILAKRPDEAWIVWCNTDYEADALKAAIPSLVEVRGSDSISRKEAVVEGFCNGSILHVVTKGAIFGMGMNFQHCRNILIFLDYSYEKFYQLIRRCWRFGQTREVFAHVVCAETEGPVLTTIQRKQRDHERMKAEMIEAMKNQTMLELGQGPTLNMDFERDSKSGEGWEIRLGDSVELIKEVPDNHIRFSIFSPPFSNLYIYSDSVRDMGNTADDKEFFESFSHLARELYRVTLPGRVTAIHCKDLPTYRGRDGASGLKDFPGDIIRCFENNGWSFHSRVTIWKCPVTERERTNNNGLLHKTVMRDSSQLRMGMADYLIVMRKTPLGDSNLSDVPIERMDGFEEYYGDSDPRKNAFHPSPYARVEFDGKRDSIAIWRRYAEPVWWDIDQTDVLNVKSSRSETEERHICPLQMGVIERAIAIWSLPGELVYSPFAGIGSEGVGALKLGREFLGMELKREYFEIAARNLKEAQSVQWSMFDDLEQPA